MPVLCWGSFFLRERALGPTMQRASVATRPCGKLPLVGSVTERLAVRVATPSMDRTPARPPAITFLSANRRACALDATTR